MTKFSCPHCGDFFFASKTFYRDSGDNFLLFGMKFWPNTSCKWPLWKLVADKALKPASKRAG